MPPLRSLVLLGLLHLTACAPEEPVSFNRDIRPIFNAKCVACHGGVKQAGGFGLVFREDALGPTDSGRPAIVPGHPNRSGLVARITHPDPTLRMPFEGAALPPGEIDLLRRWIEQGAEWEEHWAYLPSHPHPASTAANTGRDQHPVDYFVRAGLTEKDIAPAPPADRATLLRRVSFDLTGLPPDAALAEAFLSDVDPLPYTALVDSLLASPRYGEHLAAHWLELARYADSRGYERDRLRSIWQYRDWVIRTFNADVPFDRFTVEQLAGDLLPNPTDDQLIATGFHRNTLSNDEGGTNNEEYRVTTVIDRVNTTWEVWQGTTMACVQCHGHPYDPLRQEDFYRSYALFNNTVDHDHVSESPYLRTLYAADEQRYRRLADWIAEDTKGPGGATSAWTEQGLHRMLKLGEPRIRPYHFVDIEGGVFTDRGDEDALVLRNGNTFSLPARALDSIGALHLNAGHRAPGRLEVRLDGPAGPLVAERSWTGWRGFTTDRLVLPELKGQHRLYFRVTGAGSDPLLQVYTVAYEPRLPGRERAGYAEIEVYLEELLRARDSTHTLVLQELPPDRQRTTHVFERGNWLVPGREVSGGVPDLLPPLPAGVAADRLAFARWLVTPGQPLTARVTANRLWALVFGRGLVTTLADFGSQSDPPVYPALLDHLALEFSGPLAWSVKGLLRHLVTSATYRQSSYASPALREADPFNDLLARGPRSRLTAEEVRDQVLAVSGLLSEKMYGPGVYPPQPAGLWDQIPYSSERYVESTGEDRYRRAVYTFLRRSVVHPLLTTFDGSNRELCLAQRSTTNTPLQALLTLNDPAHLEAAEQLAGELVKIADPRTRFTQLYVRALARPVREGEIDPLLELYHRAAAHYDGGTAAGDRAATVLVINAVFNLDEFLTTS